MLLRKGQVVVGLVGGAKWYHGNRNLQLRDGDLSFTILQACT